MITQKPVQELTKSPLPRKRISIIKTMIVKESSILYGARQINSPELAAKLAHNLFIGVDREMLIVAALDSKCNPLSLEIAAIGNLNTCIVSPREIFKSSILSNAAFIIVFHNHLSGDCTPSKEDISVTRRLIEVGDLLGIPLLDHIVIGEGDNYCSIREENLVSFKMVQSLYCN